jgi:hypothetical protein
MHGPINVKSPNNISKWQMGFNSAFKGLKVNNLLSGYKYPNLFHIIHKEVFTANGVSTKSDACAGFNYSELDWQVSASN